MTNQLRYTLMLRVYGEEKIFGPGIAELLERVEQTHSMRKATQDMGMAYSKAWRIVKTAENALGCGFFIKALDHSPITGPKGNIEYLMYLSKVPTGENIDINEEAKKVVELSHEELM